MPLNRPDGMVSWDALGRDNLLRNKDAPALFDDPVTARGIRGGEEVVSRGGNIMPRAITRDKLGDDALLYAMNLNVSSSSVVMVATGRMKALNDYIFAVTWDGTNFYLRRFNTLDLLSPYQDAYSVNLPVDANRDDVLGVSVLTDSVAVLYQAKNGNSSDVVMALFDFDLNYVSTVSAPRLANATGAAYRNVTFDNNYLVHSYSASSRLRFRQMFSNNWTTVPGGSNYSSQKITTQAAAGNITRIGLYLRNTSPSNQARYHVYLVDASDNVLFSELNVQMPASTAEGWVYFDMDVAVSNSTAYFIALQWSGTGGTTQPDWAYQNTDVYSGGYGSLSPTSRNPSTSTTNDFMFQVWQKAPSSLAGKIARYDPATYALVDSYAWPSGTQPTELMAFDGKFYYGLYGTTLVKFAIVNGAISVASTQPIQETVRGILNFNSFLHVVYAIGTTTVGVPVSI